MHKILSHTEKEGVKVNLDLFVFSQYDLAIMKSHISAISKHIVWIILYEYSVNIVGESKLVSSTKICKERVK